MDTVLNNVAERQEILSPQEVAAKQEFESIISSIRYTINGIAVQSIHDNNIRINYNFELERMSQQLRLEAHSGRMTWSQAARQASETRNVVMELLRGKSSPLGRSIAEWMKPKGRSFSMLLDVNANSYYGMQFNALSPLQRNTVYGAIVASAGRNNIMVSTTLNSVSKFCRGIIIFSLAISLYNIGMADNQVDTAMKEGAMFTGGILGSIAGGAVAGLACGPASPICVPIGVFVGGVMAVYSVDYYW
ncbi:hypothetical protein [Zophobihabitans entericus]|uniref:Uncharacterized protein n=1 Tax=Zophobihabitans entericus TaxID=1635327 RepID=A0A6G9IEB3_9GAMM|nr:hypothetical protein [Zophobihabitans entericus]QIQ22167.1 hypothetical protein IPMB12_11005 [Zophobihabitans entericus]